MARLGRYCGLFVKHCFGQLLGRPKSGRIDVDRLGQRLYSCTDGDVCLERGVAKLEVEDHRKRKT